MSPRDVDIDYDELVQAAMRGVIRQVLVLVAKEGRLPGEHHFYISFSTQAQGVILSKRLKEKYPDEMTIVLQHRFWELNVSEDRFEVKLTFDSIPERLVIPFKAIRVFLDPSVRFGQQFEDSQAHPDGNENDAPEIATPRGPRPVTAKAAEAKPERRRPSSTRNKTRVNDEDALDSLERSGSEAAALATAAKDKPPAGKPTLVEKPAAGPKVVSLDQFRKK